MAAYLHEIEQGRPRVAELDRLLVHLALPSLGPVGRHAPRAWPGTSARGPTPARTRWGTSGTSSTGRIAIDPACLPSTAGSRTASTASRPATRAARRCKSSTALVPYRNAVFGHGAGRFESFYEKEMGPLLFPAANELLAEGMLDVLGPRGSRLVHLAELRMLDEDRVEVGLRELVGERTARAAPLILSRAQAAALVPGPRGGALAGPAGAAAARSAAAVPRGRAGRRGAVPEPRPQRPPGRVPQLHPRRARARPRRPPRPWRRCWAGSPAARSAPSSSTRLPSRAWPRRPRSRSSSARRRSRLRVLGDYEILAEIGRGGMGVVYLARQLSLGRLVALKMLPADLAGDEVALARFRREMRLLARCDHPNIVKVLASGTHARRPALLRDGVRARLRPRAGLARAGGLGSCAGDTSTLGSTHLGPRRALGQPQDARAELRGRPRRPSASPQPAPALPLPPLPELPSAPDDPGGYARRVAALVRDAALALQAVHDQQVVHRDVKPANLMLSPDGARVVLMDFGLAKGQSLELAASRAGGLLGTLRYAAPEQLAAASLQRRPGGRRAWTGRDALGALDPPPALRRGRGRAATRHDGPRPRRAAAAHDRPQASTATWRRSWRGRPSAAWQTGSPRRAS